MLSDAVCVDSGTEIAHWLFWQKNTTGAFHTPAKFSGGVEVAARGRAVAEVADA